MKSDNLGWGEAGEKIEKALSLGMRGFVPRMRNRKGEGEW